MKKENKIVKNVWGSLEEILKRSFNPHFMDFRCSLKNPIIAIKANPKSEDFI